MGLHDGITRIIAERQEARAPRAPRKERIADERMQRFARIKAALGRLVAEYDPRCVKSRLFDDKALLWLGYDRAEISWAVRQKTELDLASDDAQIVVNEIDYKEPSHGQQTTLSFSHEHTLTTYLQARIESRLARDPRSTRLDATDGEPTNPGSRR